MTDLSKEFMSGPEGILREGSLVVRPSLRAALERFVVALAGVSLFFAPFVLLSYLNVDASPGGPGFVGALDAVTTLVIPILFSFAPAVQLLFTRYIFDDEGVRVRVQILSKTENRVPWEKVTALHQRRSVIDRILGIERLDVVAYGARGTTLKLVGLDDAAPLRNLAARQMRATADVRRLLSND